MQSTTKTNCLLKRLRRRGRGDGEGGVGEDGEGAVEGLAAVSGERERLGRLPAHEEPPDHHPGVKGQGEGHPRPGALGGGKDTGGIL